MAVSELFSANAVGFGNKGSHGRELIAPWPSSPLRYLPEDWGLSGKLPHMISDRALFRKKRTWARVCLLTDQLGAVWPHSMSVRPKWCTVSTFSSTLGTGANARLSWSNDELSSVNLGATTKEWEFANPRLGQGAKTPLEIGLVGLQRNWVDFVRCLLIRWRGTMEIKQKCRRIKEPDGIEGCWEGERIALKLFLKMYWETCPSSEKTSWLGEVSSSCLPNWHYFWWLSWPFNKIVIFTSMWASGCEGWEGGVVALGKNLATASWLPGWGRGLEGMALRVERRFLVK